MLQRDPDSDDGERSEWRKPLLLSKKDLIRYY